MTPLIATARALMAPGKGLLAMDESVATCNRRLAEFGIAQTEASRRRYRELLVTAPGLSESISGAILFDETLHQNTRDGLPFADVLRSAGILVGIKVDAGASALAGQHGELVTEGLDGLRNRLQCYASLGARFAKWRAVLAIGDESPSRACIEANAHTLARCAEITAEVLHPVFEQLHRQGVALEAMLLKPNRVLPGLACAEPVSLDDVADATLRCLLNAVPAAVAGVAFLSGGQADGLATARLNAMHLRSTLGGPASTLARPCLPWPLTFLFGRLLHDAALGLWAGNDDNGIVAQRALLHRARCNGAAAQGAWRPAMETEWLPA